MAIICSVLSVVLCSPILLPYKRLPTVNQQGSEVSVAIITHYYSDGNKCSLYKWMGKYICPQLCPQNCPFQCKEWGISLVQETHFMAVSTGNLIIDQTSFLISANITILAYKSGILYFSSDSVSSGVAFQNSHTQK